MEILGAWELRNSKPTLYTSRAADIIKNKRTGKEYRRGKFVFNEKQNPPNAQRVEDTDDYEFIYLEKDVEGAINIGQEILTNLWLRK